jgi:hypothetical protein
VYANGPAYNPPTVAQIGLLAYNRWKSNHEAKDRETFLRMARWLIDHQDAASGGWYCDFEYPYASLNEKLQKHWLSAMSQGQGASLLLRAYHATQDALYERAAVKAIQPFKFEIENGGVTRPFVLPGGAQAAGLQFYEEYPTQAPSYVLNGFMFALLGLFDVSQIPNADAALLFQRGMQTLDVALPLYDLGYGTSYDLVHLVRPSAPVNHLFAYHLLHIVLLNALGTAGHDTKLLSYRDRWNSYGTKIDVWRLYLRHVGVWLVLRNPVVSFAGASAALLLFLAAVLGFRKRVHSKGTTGSLA